MAVKRDYTALLKESLNELKAIREGSIKPARVTIMSSIEPAEVRRGLNVSRPQFAALIGVSERTIEGWEQGRTKPTGAARALLRIAANNPKAVLKALS